MIRFRLHDAASDGRRGSPRDRILPVPVAVVLLVATLSMAAPIDSVAISLDNTSTTAAKNVGSRVSWTHTVGSDASSLLVVGMSFRRQNGQTVTGVTYGGVPLTFIGAGISTDLNNKYRAELWYLLAPSPGSGTVRATFSAGNDFYGGGDDLIDAVVGGAASFFGVDQEDPIGVFSSNGGVAGIPTTIVSSQAEELVVDVLAIKGRNLNSVAAGEGQTDIWNDETGNNAHNEVIGAFSSEPGSESVTMQWSVTSEEQWAQCAVPLRPAAPDEPAEADLAISKVVDNATPNVGETITYTIQVVNNGPSDVAGVEILDALPEGIHFESYSASQGTYDDESGVWDVGSVSNGSNATLSISVTVGAPQ